MDWARSVSSIWNHKYDFRQKFHNTKFNYPFITSTWPEIWFVTLNKIWNLFGYCAVLVFLFHWLGKRCNLGQKMVQFGNKSHSWEPIRLHGWPVISKVNVINAKICCWKLLSNISHFSTSNFYHLIFDDNCNPWIIKKGKILVSIINNQKQHLLSNYKYNVYKVPLAKSSSSCRALDVDFADDDRGGELDKLELESLTKKENLGIKAGLLHHLVQPRSPTELHNSDFIQTM